MQTEIIKAIRAVVKNQFNVDLVVNLTRPDPQFGDFTTNLALQLGKQLSRSPREVAEEITTSFNHSAVARVEVAGAGFINFSLTNEALVSLMNQPLATPLEGKEVVAEYSDPNPFKVLHAGHLYTSLMGDAIANLLENAGANVHRVNFGGDVGLHVAKTMWAIIQDLEGEHPEKLAEVDEVSRLEWVSQRYAEGEQAYTDNEVAKQQIIAYNKQIYALHENNDHESTFAQIYWTCREWSYDGFNSLYDRLQMVPFERYYPESLTTPYGTSAVKVGQAKGVFVESDGAVVYKGEDDGLHTRVFLTSEGLPTYEAKDLGLALKKWEDYHFDLSVMITGDEIVEYMKVVQAALKHFNPDIVERSKHLTHGHVKLLGGVKMSSRKGNSLTASDVLDAAREANKSATGKDDQAVVLGAVKYGFIKQRMGGDIIYDPKESVSLEGNSGPYLQYAHARAASILRKASTKPGDIKDIESGERALVRKLGEFSEVVDQATTELMPHHIASYLYELAQEFNRFYENNKVIGDSREATRLNLVTIYASTLKRGLGLLGIVAPEKM